MTEKALDDNRIFDRIQNDTQFPLGQRRDNATLFASAEKGSLRALQMLGMQFQKHPELATAQNIDVLSAMAEDKSATSKFRQTAQDVLEAIRNPNTAPEKRFGAGPIAPARRAALDL